MVSDIAAKWPLVAIGELASADEGAIAIGPFGSSMKADTYTATGIPVVRGNNLTGRPGFFGEFVFVSEATARRFARCLVKPGDLVFPHRGAIGEVGLVIDQGFEQWMLSTSMMKLRPDRTRLDSRFAFYFFRSALGRHQLLKNASQVGTPGIGQPLASLRACELSLPPLDEQQAITNVLGALDDKIEQNRRTALVLERLAQAIFRAWFVDFEPVKAKAAGATAFPSMPQNVFDALPTCFIDSDLGPVPEGWESGKLGDIIEIHDSRRIPLSRRQRDERHGPYPYYGAAGVVDYVDDFLFDGVYILVGEDGTVFSNDDRPMVQYVWGQFWVNNHAHVLTGSAGYTTEHLRVLLDHVNIRPFVTGAVQPKLNQGNLKSVPVVLASRQVVESFGKKVAPAFQLIRQIEDESRKLGEIRDYLLPGLLTGSIRVEAAHD